MSIARHSRRWWNFCMSEDEKRKIEPFLLGNVFSVHY